MKIKYNTLLLAAFAISNSQSVVAHNEAPSFEKRKAERQQGAEKKDQETWDDFMKAVKAQEKKPETEAKPEKEESSKQHNH